MRQKVRRFLLIAKDLVDLDVEDFCILSFSEAFVEEDEEDSIHLRRKIVLLLLKILKNAKKGEKKNILNMYPSICKFSYHTHVHIIRAE